MAKIKVCDKAFENIKNKVEAMQKKLAEDVHKRMVKEMALSTPLIYEEYPQHESVETINEDELVGYIMRNNKELHLTYEEVRAVLDTEIDFLKEKGIIKAD